MIKRAGIEENSRVEMKAARLWVMGGGEVCGLEPFAVPFGMPFEVLFTPFDVPLEAILSCVSPSRILKLKIHASPRSNRSLTQSRWLSFNVERTTLHSFNTLCWVAWTSSMRISLV